MFKKFLIISALCLNAVSLYAETTCNPNGLTSSGDSTAISTQDAVCPSGQYCSLTNKKCVAKNALEKTCNRNAQCAEGTCSNSKCLLVAGSSCSVATNCASGVCNWNAGQTNILGKCA